jgi:lipopolysaccharide biosynthesis glycosyltransferase
MHYAGGGKPWMPNCSLPFTNEYLSFYNKTAWKPPIFTRCYLAFKNMVRKIIHD